MDPGEPKLAYKINLGADPLVRRRSGVGVGNSNSIRSPRGESFQREISPESSHDVETAVSATGGSAQNGASTVQVPPNIPWMPNLSFWDTLSSVPLLKKRNAKSCSRASPGWLKQGKLVAFVKHLLEKGG
jgi:hypothetical protein